MRGMNMKSLEFTIVYCIIRDIYSYIYNSFYLCYFNLLFICMSLIRYLLIFFYILYCLEMIFDLLEEISVFYLVIFVFVTYQFMSFHGFSIFKLLYIYLYSHFLFTSYNHILPQDLHIFIGLSTVEMHYIHMSHISRDGGKSCREVFAPLLNLRVYQARINYQAQANACVFMGVSLSLSLFASEGMHVYQLSHLIFDYYLPAKNKRLIQKKT